MSVLTASRSSLGTPSARALPLTGQTSADYPAHPLYTRAAAALEARLDELARLRKGWLDGEGLPVDPALIARARRTLLPLIFLGVPPPRVFPTEDGGIQAEWLKPPAAVSLAFERGRRLTATSVNVEAGSTAEVDSFDSAQQLAGFVLQVR